MLFSPHVSPLQSKLSKPNVFNKSFLLSPLSSSYHFSPLKLPALSYHFSPLQSKLPKPIVFNKSFLFNPKSSHTTSLLFSSLPFHITSLLCSPSSRNQMFEITCSSSVHCPCKPLLSSSVQAPETTCFKYILPLQSTVLSYYFSPFSPLPFHIAFLLCSPRAWKTTLKRKD